MGQQKPSTKLFLNSYFCLFLLLWVSFSVIAINYLKPKDVQISLDDSCATQINDCSQVLNQINSYEEKLNTQLDNARRLGEFSKISLSFLRYDIETISLSDTDIFSQIFPIPPNNSSTSEVSSTSTNSRFFNNASTTLLECPNNLLISKTTLENYAVLKEQLLNSIKACKLAQVSRIPMMGILNSFAQSGTSTDTSKKYFLGISFKLDTTSIIFIFILVFISLIALLRIVKEFVLFCSRKKKYFFYSENNQDENI